MNLTEYQRLFLVDLLTAQSEFLIIGAVGMSAHGYTRPTKDLDLWINPTATNARKTLPVISRRFRQMPPELTEAFLALPRKRISLPSDQIKEIDLLTSLGALDFYRSTEAGLTWCLAGLEVKALGLTELIYSKILSAGSNDSPQAKERDASDFVELLKLLGPAA